MNTICLDIGTTAAKAAAFQDGRRIGDVVRKPVPLKLHESMAELNADLMVQLAFDLLRLAGQQLAGNVDRIAMATMCPAVCLLDGAGAALTPLLCHLDRRSEPQALDMARHFGEKDLLAITGNLPVPGGIASTLLRWMQTQQANTWSQLARVAPLTTLLVSRLTGRYACDPGTAAFLGTFDIRHSRGAPDLRPWGPMLEFLHLPAGALPDVADGGQTAGPLRPEIAAHLGLNSLPEVLVGLMDTSAACLQAGLVVGNVYNVIGTTDVLVICTDTPLPRRDVLTRPVGTGPLWFGINTMAAAGAALDWAHRTFFADLQQEPFFALVRQLGQVLGEQRQTPGQGRLQFLPDLAGSRMRVRQGYGQIKGLRLSTTREDILATLLGSLARQGRRRLRVLSQLARPNGQVWLTGGASVSGAFRLWPDRYRPAMLPDDASLQGLARLAGERP
jgi:xylulokinase